MADADWLSPPVYLEVDSLLPVDAIRPAVVAWVDRVYRETVVPVVEWYRMVAEVGVLGEPPDRWRRLRDEHVWTDALATLAGPEGKFLVVGAGEIEQGISFGVDLQIHQGASRLDIELSAGLSSGQDWPALQERLLEHFVAAAEAAGASTGFITTDDDVANTPYEERMHRTQRQGWAESDRWLRGVFWCTLLSHGHLDALGGIDRVEQEAPAAQTRRLESPNGPLLLLRASEDLATCSDDALAPLYDFLAPVLPPPTRFPDIPDRAPEPPRPDPTIEVDPEIDADVSVQLTFAGLLDDADRLTLDQLLDAWYVLGVHGVFGDPVHNMDATAYDEAGQQTICTVGIDLGNAGVDAVDPLVRLLVAAKDELKPPLMQVVVRNL